MMRADGVTKREEFVVLCHELQKFNVSGSEFTNLLKSAQAMDSSEMFAILSDLDVDVQKYVCGFLVAIMMADRDIDDSEMKAWQLICTLSDFPMMSAREALDIWLERQ